MWTHVSNYLFYPHPRENASVIFREPCPYRRCFRCSRSVYRANPTPRAQPGPHPRQGVGLPPTPRRRSRPVVDVVPDDPPLRPPPAPPRSANPRPGAGCTRGILRGARPCPQPPRRGRRPRRPERSSTAHLAAFRRPPPGRGMLSRYIMRHAVKSRRNP